MDINQMSSEKSIYQYQYIIIHYTSSTNNFSWPKRKESQMPTAANHSSWKIDSEGSLSNKVK